MILAADEPTVWSWLALAGIAVLLGFVAYGVILLNRFEHRKIDEARVKASRVPDDLLPPRDPVGPVVAILGCGLAVAMGAGVGLGRTVAVVAGSLVVVVGYLRLERHRAAHRREVIALVGKRAHSMGHQELAELIEGLEVAYGRNEMRELRQLLPAVPGRSRPEHRHAT